jgi:hypothetical protein
MEGNWLSDKLFELSHPGLDSQIRERQSPGRLTDHMTVRMNIFQ